MTQKLKVLLVRGCRGITDITGAERYILTLLESMDSNVCEYQLVCITDPRTMDSQWLNELQRRKINYISIPISTPITIKDIRAVYRLINETNADIVHSIDHRADLAGIMAAKLRRRASVVSFFGWTNFEKNSFRARVYPWVNRRMQKRADVIITDSKATVPSIDWGGTPPVKVVHNGVDTEKFNPAKYDTTLKQQYFNDDSVLIIGMVGRIHPVKGQLEFLQAAEYIYKQHPNCRFLIIGEVPLGYEFYEQKLAQQIKIAGLEKVALITNVHTKKIPQVFAAIDILAAPSHKESFSFTMLEAMSMEIPIVATRVGGNPEMVSHEKTGFLVELGDMNDFIQSLGRLVVDQQKRKTVGKYARKWILDNCSTKIMASKTAQIYAQVLENRV